MRKPEDYRIAVTGDPLRNNAYVFAHNGFLGYPRRKKIQLPKDWEQKLAQARSALRRAGSETRVWPL